MSDAVLAAFINGAFLLIGAAISWLITHRRSASEACRRQLMAALRDVIAFHKLEQRYVAALAEVSPGKSAHAWKLAIRKDQRGNGVQTPSDEATTFQAEQMLQRLR